MKIFAFLFLCVLLFIGTFIGAFIVGRSETLRVPQEKGKRILFWILSFIVGNVAIFLFFRIWRACREGFSAFNDALFF